MQDSLHMLFASFNTVTARPELSFECVLLTLFQAISDWAKSRTLQQQRQFLPVYDCREELLQVIRENQVVVVVGETGSGKTTQVMHPPPALYHACVFV